MKQAQKPAPSIFLLFVLLLVACGGAAPDATAVLAAPTAAGGSAPAPVRVNLSAIKGTSPGGQASATVSTTPHTRCTIVYTMPDGRVGNAAGLGPKTTDAQGRATWTWTVTTTTAPGIGTVAVTCGGVTGSERLLIGIGE